VEAEVVVLDPLAEVAELAEQALASGISQYQQDRFIQSLQQQHKRLLEILHQQVLDQHQVTLLQRHQLPTVAVAVAEDQADLHSHQALQVTQEVQAVRVTAFQ
jgi:hypothetical protein